MPEQMLPSTIYADPTPAPQAVPTNNKTSSYLDLLRDEMAIRSAVFGAMLNSSVKGQEVKFFSKILDYLDAEVTELGEKIDAEQERVNKLGA